MPNVTVTYPAQLIDTHLLNRRSGLSSVSGDFDYTLGGTLTPFAGFVGWRAGAFWQDVAQMVPAGVGDPIESWREIYSGANRHATQATLAKKPTVILTAAGRLGASFDDVDDALKTALFAAVPQPTMVYAVAQRVSALNARHYIFDGNASASYTLYHAITVFLYTAAAPTTLASAVASTSMDCMTVQFSGATSRLWRNGTLIAGPGNAGANSVTAVTLGAQGALNLPLGGTILAHLGYSGTHTDAQRNAIIAALMAEAGI